MRRGGLYKRPGGNVYYARWTLKGKTYAVSTGKASKREAETRLAELVRPFVLADEKALSQSVAAHIAGAEAELAQIERDQAGERRLADAWTAYKRTRNRPDTGPATMHQYELQFAAFEEWASKRKPPIVLMSEVDDQVATDFIAHLERKRRTANTINKYLNLFHLVTCQGPYMLCHPGTSLSAGYALQLRMSRLWVSSRVVISLVRSLCERCGGIAVTG